MYSCTDFHTPQHKTHARHRHSCNHVPLNENSALRSNNCKAQEAVALAEWLQWASSPLIYPKKSEGAISFSTDGTQHRDWLNTNLAPPSVFSCLRSITDTQQSAGMFLYLHIPFLFLLGMLRCSLVIFFYVILVIFVSCFNVSLARQSESHKKMLSYYILIL